MPPSVDAEFDHDATKSMAIHPWQSSKPLSVTLKKVAYKCAFSISCPQAGSLASGLSLALQLDSRLLSLVQGESKRLPKDHADIFHRDYAEIDSGNVIDESGHVSELLDMLAESVKATCASNFNKVTWRHCEQTDLKDLHIDYFNSAKGDCKRGAERVFRYLFNLGDTVRYTAVLPIPTSLFAAAPDTNSGEHFLDPILSRHDKPLVAYLIPVPPLVLSAGRVNALRLDVLNLMHSGYGQAGELAGIVTSHE